MSDDAMTLKRLLAHPHAVPCILKLCEYSSDMNQVMTFQVLDRLCKSTNGAQVLLDNNIYNTLISAEMLSRSSTLVSVRHSAANLVHKLALSCPENLPVQKLDSVVIVNGKRTVDGYVEAHLINALLSHLT
jgi:hypothetical protein